eukprot:13675631-Ditylum_brightwellii.AAC.1
MGMMLELRKQITATSVGGLSKIDNCHSSIIIDNHDLLYVKGEDYYPKCELCGMQTDPFKVLHQYTAHCIRGQQARAQADTAVKSARALQEVTTPYGEELKRVEVFKYLGRLMAMDNTDSRAIRSNMRKARGVWAR